MGVHLLVAVVCEVPELHVMWRACMGWLEVLIVCAIPFALGSYMSIPFSIRTVRLLYNVPFW